MTSAQNDISDVSYHGKAVLLHTERARQVLTWCLLLEIWKTHTPFVNCCFQTAAVSPIFSCSTCHQRKASGHFKNNTPKTPKINTNSKKLCNWATAIPELWWAIGLGYISLKTRHKVVLDCRSHARVNQLQLR
jgi:hypothetical protein